MSKSRIRINTQISAILFILLFLSCNSSEKVLKVLKEFTRTKVITKAVKTDNKDYFFIGISHIGTKEYYSNIKKIVDSLKNEKYFFITESLIPESNLDSTIYYRKKIRKIFGETINEHYLDTINHKYLNKYSYPAKLKLINQPSDKELLRTSSYKNIDTKASILVQEFEQKYYKVILDKCDYETGIYEEYNCEKIPTEYSKIFWDEFIIKRRNQKVINKVRIMGYHKICVIYGSSHIEGMVEELEKQEIIF